MLNLLDFCLSWECCLWEHFWIQHGPSLELGHHSSKVPCIFPISTFWLMLFSLPLSPSPHYGRYPDPTPHSPIHRNFSKLGFSTSPWSSPRPLSVVHKFLGLPDSQNFLSLYFCLLVHLCCLVTFFNHYLLYSHHLTLCEFVFTSQLSEL